MRKIIPGVKDANGAFLPPPKHVESSSPLSIDGILHDCLVNLRRIVDKISTETTLPGLPAKDTVQMLKDCTSMLMALQKQEKDILDKMSVDDLKNLIKGRK